MGGALALSLLMALPTLRMQWFTNFRLLAGAQLFCMCGTGAEQRRRELSIVAC